MKRLVVGVALLVLTLGLGSVLSQEPAPSTSGEKSSDWVGRGEVVRIVAGIDLRLAREEAIDELKELSERPRGHAVFNLGDPSRLRDGVIGEPFLYYWAGDEFGNFENAHPNTILDFMRGFTIRFPIVLGNEPLGTLNVTKTSAEGGYRVLTRTNGTKLYDRVVVVRSLYPASDGWTVAVVNTGLAGTYFFLTDGLGRIQLSPANRGATHIYELDPAEDNVLNFVPLLDATTRIKNVLKTTSSRRERGQE
jgi:hypothetical protein